jgi:hypothetical protein
MPGVSAPPTQKKSKGFLPLPLQSIKLHRRAGLLKYDHHSIGDAAMIRWSALF